MEMIKPDPNTRLEQLETLYQTAPMGIAVLSHSYQFETCNPALERKLGYSVDEIHKFTLTELCHPWDRNKALKMIEAANAQSEYDAYTREEIRLHRKDKSYLWVEISIRIIPKDVDSTSRYVIMVQNIQKRKEIQIELVELRRKMLNKTEADRNKLAHDLHDGPMQDLHSVSYQIAALMGEVDPRLEPNLEAILKTIRSINQGLRVIAYDLRPATLSKFGLASSIKTHVDEFKVKHPKLEIQLDLVADNNLICEEISLALFRIYQQALMNIVRHANATEVKIVLGMDGDGVTLEVIDNGRGFYVPERWISLVRAGHYGLAGTSERVHALGGTFKLFSAPGEGTRVFVQIPDYMEDK